MLKTKIKKATKKAAPKPDAVGRTLESLADVTVTAEQFAGLIGVGVRRAQQIVVEAGLPKDQRNRYPLLEGIRGYVRYLQERVPKRNEAQGDASSEKATKTALESELLKLKLSRERGELILVEEVERTWSQLIQTVRTKFLGIPTKAAPQVMAATSEAHAKAMLDKLVYEVLDELGGSQPDSGGSGSGIPETVQPGVLQGQVEVPPTPDALGESMGGPEPEALP